MENARRAATAGVVVSVLLASMAVSAAAAATFSMTLETGQAAYSGTEAIVIEGKISPPPGANTVVVIEITNFTGGIADVDEAIPDPATGVFNYTSHPGASPAWTTGTFNVNATWSGDGATVSQVTMFDYVAPASSTSASRSTSTSAAPEFPTGALAALFLFAAGMAAVLSRRFGVGPPPPTEN